jgi:hypothetical protein
MVFIFLEADSGGTKAKFRESDILGEFARQVTGLMLGLAR